ncbi:uncharacterized protein [Melopsittacus undulatus]|uniref:uncharacterized protein n=1 Tax=Melopsittacus undulatus TaxID=13146 RepID=UPI00146B513D|nr:uncharacterized protein LOC117435994 [Melopsittacus undulatus]
MSSRRRQKLHSQYDSAAMLFFLVLLLLLTVCGGSVPTPLRALRRGSAPDTQQPGQQRGALSCGRGEQRRRGPSSPAPSGSASVTARPPSWFHLSLEARGLPASGGTGRPPVFKGTAAPTGQRVGFVSLSTVRYWWLHGALAAPHRHHRAQHRPHAANGTAGIAAGAARAGHPWTRPGPLPRAQGGAAQGDSALGGGAGSSRALRRALPEQR